MRTIKHTVTDWDAPADECCRHPLKTVEVPAECRECKGPVDIEPIASFRDAGGYEHHEDHVVCSQCGHAVRLADLVHVPQPPQQT